MRKGMRRNYHKSLMRIIHEANKSLMRDELFKGRFEIGLVNEDWIEFFDHSGGKLFITVRVYDKGTNCYMDYYLSYAPYFRTFHWKLGMDAINDFIVNRSGYWDETPKHTKNNTIDYTKCKVDWSELNKEPIEYFYVLKPKKNYLMRCRNEQ